MQEQLNELKKKFETMMNTTLSRPNEDWKGMQAVNYLFSILAMQDSFSKTRNEMSLSPADEMFLSEVLKMAKEYESKMYEIAKPFIELYYDGITSWGLKDFTSEVFLRDLEKCAKLVEEEKTNPNHTQDIKGPQISIIKSFAYYLNKEFEDKMDSRCRAKYYEILKM